MGASNGFRGDHYREMIALPTSHGSESLFYCYVLGNDIDW